MSAPVQNPGRVGLPYPVPRCRAVPPNSVSAACLANPPSPTPVPPMSAPLPNINN